MCLLQTTYENYMRIKQLEFVSRSHEKNIVAPQGRTTNFQKQHSIQY